MKRFYKNVSVGEQDGVYTILLDGAPIKTPARALLTLPTKTLAEALAEEWRGQGETLNLAAMPLTKIANTAIDLVPHKRGVVCGEVLRFGAADLLCYRADNAPDLAARQAAHWDPLLAWAAQTHAASLVSTTGITFAEQPAEARMALEKTVWERDDFALAALQLAASLCGSLVLALALADAKLDADGAFAAARLDEDFQAERWGRDAEAEARAQSLRTELAAAERVFRALTE